MANFYFLGEIELCGHTLFSPLTSSKFVLGRVLIRGSHPIRKGGSLGIGRPAPGRGLVPYAFPIRPEPGFVKARWWVIVPICCYLLFGVTTQRPQRRL